MLGGADFLSPYALPGYQPPFISHYNDPNVRYGPSRTQASNSTAQKPTQTSFSNDSSEQDVPSLSHFRFGSGNPELDNPDRRRPSVASTISSNASGSSHSEKFRRRLQGFFGDNQVDEELDPRQASKLDDDRSHQYSFSSERTGSAGSWRVPENQASTPVEPGPPLPPPSEEIAPWLHQKVSISVDMTGVTGADKNGISRTFPGPVTCQFRNTQPRGQPCGSRRKAASRPKKLTGYCIPSIPVAGKRRR